MKDGRYSMMVARRSDGRIITRPLSPHLQVYRWPVSMTLSIAHRATGIGLSVGALLMTWWLVAAAASDDAFATVQSFLGSGFGVFLLMGWAAALLLHLFLGIRHLVWDAGWGFGTLAQQEAVRMGSGIRIYRVTDWGVIGVAVLATLAVWIAGVRALVSRRGDDRQARPSARSVARTRPRRCALWLQSMVGRAAARPAPR